MFIHKFWYLLDHHLSFKLFLKLLNLLINTFNALSLILFGVYLSNKKYKKKYFREKRNNQIIINQFLSINFWF